MKTIIMRSFCFLAVCLLLSGCEKKFGEGVTLKDIATEGETSIRVNIGEVGKLYAFPIPYDCTDYEFKWESADPSIATVDDFGRVASVDVGTTTISVSQGNIRKEFAVEVYEVTLAEKLQKLGVKA
ncbi:MAG: Ig-like domain-containing protein, partial [Tannerella sp.]|nr:Ig-like domain-containing protein [Tannerella sp.]